MNCWGTANYYAPGASNLTTPLSRCPSCKAIRRDLSGDIITSHYDVASYTDLSNEDRFYKERMLFFAYLYRLAQTCAATPIVSCLDFGSSYGHFLQLLKARGCDAVGIEIVDSVRAASQAKGLTVFSSFDDLLEHKREQQFDLITMIDSLYYVDDPRRTLRSIRRLLHKEGILLVRITNRNWITWLLRKVCGRTHYGSWLGDAAISLGGKSIECLLVDSGFSVARWVYWERGKAMPLFRRALYDLASLTTWASRGVIPLSAGIIVVAKKSALAGKDVP